MIGHYGQKKWAATNQLPGRGIVVWIRSFIEPDLFDNTVPFDNTTPTTKWDRMCNFIFCWSNGCVLLARCYVKFAKDKVLVFVIFREKCENSATVSLTPILTLISRGDWKDKSEWYYRTIIISQKGGFVYMDKKLCGDSRTTRWSWKDTGGSWLMLQSERQGISQDKFTWTIFVWSPCPISTPPCDSRTEPSV